MSRRFALSVLAVITAFAVCFTGAISPPLAVAAGPDTRDIIFSLDGSGSIDSSDWQLQKDGYSAAVQDAVTFPRDGSIAVGVNQWSDPSSARVEVPLGVIDSQADVNALVSAIQGITQIGSSTDPVSGLELATQQLVNGGRQGDWRVCMSSDGVQNDGNGTIQNAAADARRAGVDRFSVVGIEDGGNGAQLRSYYRPAVFGGGTFTLARNTAEFSNLIVGGCLNEPVDLVGLEVTQGTQNWLNEVDLVSSKSTVVRAFVEVPAGADSQRVSGRLIGRRNGSELPGSPLLATNPSASVLATQNVTGRRGTLNASLNFLLPPSWRSGDVELEFDGAGTSVRCTEAAGHSADDCIADVSFTTGAHLGVQIIGVPYREGLLGPRRAPSGSDLAEQFRRLDTILPVSGLTPTYREFSFATNFSKPHVSTVNSRLSMRRFLDGCLSGLGCSDIYYGLLKGMAPVNANGGRTRGMASGIPGDVAASYLEDLDTSGSTGSARNTIAHEVGHLLGLNHDVTSTVRQGYKRGECGEVADLSAPTYPYFDTRNGRKVPLLGPLGASTDKAIWGLDARFARGDVNGLAVVDPGSNYDLMGYCEGAGQERWPSDYTWDLMRAGADGRHARGPALDTTGDHLILSGVIGDDHSLQLAAPAKTAGTFPQANSGAYTAELLGTAGAVLGTAEFDVDFDGGPADAVQLGSFIAAIPVPAQPVKAIRIRRGATTLGTLNASAAAPTVQITQPNASTVVNGANLDIRWIGDDADADDLFYTVRYSADGGSTWQTLAVDLDDTQLTIPRSQLTASTDAVVEVQGSDGVNVTVVESRHFTVTGSGPMVQILSPGDGDTFYSGVQQVVLEGIASDNEDGDVSDAIVWSSDRDGRLVTGASGTVRADQLSEGIHVLAASATDSSGDTGTAQVTIQIFRVAPVDAVPTVTISSPSNGTRVNLSGTLSLAASATDPEDGDVRASIVWTDQRGRTLLRGPSGSVPATALGVGTHVVTAAATDSAGQAGEGNVTVRVDPAPPPASPPTPGTPPPGSPGPSVANLSHEIRVSASALRGKSRALDEKQISGDAYVFFRKRGRIKSVVFRLDGRRVGRDIRAPFDMLGSVGRRAVALESRRLPNGHHVVRVKVRYADGRVARASAYFTVKNLRR